MKTLTIQDIENFTTSSFKEDKGNNLVLLTGKGGVRAFAKEMFGPGYSFRQLLGLFRSGIISGYKLYSIRT